MQDPYVRSCPVHPRNIKVFTLSLKGPEAQIKPQAYKNYQSYLREQAKRERFDDYEQVFRESDDTIKKRSQSAAPKRPLITRIDPYKLSSSRFNSAERTSKVASVVESVASPSNYDSSMLSQKVGLSLIEKIRLAQEKVLGKKRDGGAQSSTNADEIEDNQHLQAPKPDTEDHATAANLNPYTHYKVVTKKLQLQQKIIYDAAPMPQSARVPFDLHNNFIPSIKNKKLKKVESRY